MLILNPCGLRWHCHHLCRLLARGRAKKEALTILSRALLKVIYYLLRTGASYDPSAVGSSQAGS
jgi:hypothetical protein